MQLQLSQSDRLLFAGMSSGALRVYSWPLEADECLELLTVRAQPACSLATCLRAARALPFQPLTNWARRIVAGPLWVGIAVVRLAR